MHYLVKLIVEGKDAAEAMVNAESYCDSLCGADGYSGDFDWYDLKGRWGDSKAYKITSKKGKELLKEGMENTRREFDVAMAHVRYMLEHYSDDQIYEEQFGTKEEQDAIRDQNDKIYYLSRYMFSKADGRGNGVYVYNESWGGRVENQKDLDYITKDGEVLWVVPVDFHN